ncbi:hypothetical protein BY458DRAFT_509423, partial [Sporodiniella umbellata]
MMASPYTPEHPTVPLDQFRWPKPINIFLVAMIFGSAGLLAFGSEDYLRRQFTPKAIELRDWISLPYLQGLFKITGAVHAVECLYVFSVCQRRGWYSPLNTLKWIASTSLFGYTSIRELNNHAKDVYQTKL